MSEREERLRACSAALGSLLRRRASRTLFHRIPPRECQGLAQRLFVDSGKPYGRGALRAPGTGGGDEHASVLADQPLLLLRQQHDHAPVFIRVPEGREDASADAEVRMPVMSLFDRALETERQAAEAGGCHTPIIWRTSNACQEEPFGS